MATAECLRQNDTEFVLPPATCFVKKVEGDNTKNTTSVILTRPHALDPVIGKPAKAQIEEERWVKTGPEDEDEEDHSTITRKLEGTIIAVNGDGITLLVKNGTSHYDTGGDSPIPAGQVEIPFFQDTLYPGRYTSRKTTQLGQIIINGQNILANMWEQYSTLHATSGKLFLFDEGPFITWVVKTRKKTESATALKTDGAKQLQQFVGKRADITMVDERYAYREDNPVKVTTTSLKGVLIQINEFGVTLRANDGGNFLFAWRESLHEEDISDQSRKIVEVLVKGKNIIPQEVPSQDAGTFY